MSTLTLPTLRVLTVRQPHAWALVAGHKVVENRPRTSPDPGTVLAILAGLRFDPPLMVDVPEPDHYIHGAVIGAVEVIRGHVYRPTPLGCYGCNASQWRWAQPVEGMNHWLVGRAIMLDRPIPTRGSLTLAQPSDEVRDAIANARQSKGW